jgi:pilus assembly protein CpaD
MLFNKASKLKSAPIMALACTLLLSVTGCAKRSPEITGSIESNPDYRERHPIVLAETPRVLEIYSIRGSAGLDLRQDQDIRSFAFEYKTSGRGTVVASLPKGKSSDHSLSNIRRSLAAAGIPSRYIKVTSYHPLDLDSAAPIRLSFLKLQASVDSLCGQWKSDVTGASTSERFSNQSPSNFGCAYQSAIAAQVAYPLDLVRPRQEGEINIQKRIENIKSIGASKDPSTAYTTNAASVSGK